jgi:hypothetical protein
MMGNLFISGICILTCALLDKLDELDFELELELELDFELDELDEELISSVIVVKLELLEDSPYLNLSFLKSASS